MKTKEIKNKYRIKDIIIRFLKIEILEFKEN
jgi:hypothetical protein